MENSEMIVAGACFTYCAWFVPDRINSPDGNMNA